MFLQKKKKIALFKPANKIFCRFRYISVLNNIAAECTFPVHQFAFANNSGVTQLKISVDAILVSSIQIFSSFRTIL